MEIRVRYAPSPTGLQHIGGVRTALFNYFFARSQGGRFILRIEDTDRERFDGKALDDLYDTLDWLGVDWDEGPKKGGDRGPYVQSERVKIYRDHVDELVSMEWAYPCFCGTERLDALRSRQKKDRTDIGYIGYDRHCRDIDPAEAARRVEAGEAHTIRFKVPLEGKVTFNDMLLGETGRRNRDINPDPVICKSDGFPTYHLANVIDDHLMGITHVLRAQEWLPSTPLHILIYQAFDRPPPTYCHLPMVMGKDGQKLSKRHGSTSVAEFRRDGYLSEALINYVSLLGWSYDGFREFFTRDELCTLFSLEKLTASPAVFNYRKLEWFNGQYIRLKDPEELKTLLLPIMEAGGLMSHPPSSREREIFEGAFPIIRERLKTLNDVVPMLRFLFTDPGPGEPEVALPKKMDMNAACRVLKRGRELLAHASPIEHEDWDNVMEERFRSEAEKLDLKIGALLQPLRAAVTASPISPPLFPSIRLLGMEESLRRTDRLIDILSKESS